MKHAGPAALDRLDPLIARLRALPDLQEKGRGVFYRRSRAFFHFHEDPGGLHADVRLEGADFARFRVETEDEREALFATVEAALLRCASFETRLRRSSG